MSYGTCAGLNCERESVALRTCLTLGLLVEIPLCAECDQVEQEALKQRAAEHGLAVVDPRDQ